MLAGTIPEKKKKMGQIYIEKTTLYVATMPDEEIEKLEKLQDEGETDEMEDRLYEASSTVRLASRQTVVKSSSITFERC